MNFTKDLKVRHESKSIIVLNFFIVGLSYRMTLQVVNFLIAV